MKKLTLFFVSVIAWFILLSCFNNTDVEKQGIVTPLIDDVEIIWKK